MIRQTVRFLWKEHDAAVGFRSGVSLHSHTSHSREGLGFLPHWVRGVPILSWEFDRQTRRYEARIGRPPDFTTAYWTPPLSSVEAFAVERHAIEEYLGLQGIVSLSDHDNIDAGCELQGLAHQIPISVEWTVPRENTYLHVGVHNLPAATAREMMDSLAAYSSQPDRSVLHELLAWLNAQPGLLMVLNHPLWDQAAIGPGRHAEVVRRFLETAGDRIHALELNGLRPWQENRSVAALASELERTLISGGDRHGCEPGAVVNLTDASSFAEFAEEVRSGCSHVLFLPQYCEPLTLRIVQALADVLQSHPGYPGREDWTDRVFYVRGDGTRVPLSSVWDRSGPPAVRCFVRSVGLVGNSASRRVLSPLFKLMGRRVPWSTAITPSRRPVVIPG